MIVYLSIQSLSLGKIPKWWLRIQINTWHELLGALTQLNHPSLKQATF